jgi:MYXO-CTERM domain-containing protein
MHKMMIVIAAAALAVPAAAQQTDPANVSGNAVDLNAINNATGDAPMNGLATDPAMAPGAAAGTTGATTGDPAYGATQREDDDDFPWGLLGLAGLAGLLGRRKRDTDDRDVRRDRT